MSDRVGIKELASVLSERNNLPVKEVENFVSLLFETLNEGLNNDKQVKLKGLGTFKITTVSARKSIDVNTGEPIVIESRDKISFTADTIMRDLVNRPFVQFDTVILNDDINFDDVDAKYESMEVEDVEDEFENEISIEMLPRCEEQTSSVEIEGRVIKDVIETDDGNESAREEEKINVDTDRVTAHLVIDEEMLRILNGSDSVLSNKEEDESQPMRLTAQQLVLLNASLEADNSSLEKDYTIATIENLDDKNKFSEKHKLDNGLGEYKENVEENNSNILRISLLVSLFFLIFLLGGVLYYTYLQVEDRNLHISHLENLLQKKEDVKGQVKRGKKVISQERFTQKKKDSVILGDRSKQKFDTLSSTMTQVVEKKQNTVSNATAKSTSSNVERNQPLQEEHLADYDKNPLVRTGAYYIIGVDKEVLVKKGDNIKTLSSRYLGPGMECYVEAINGGITEIKIGSKVKIPKLKLKRKKTS